MPPSADGSESLDLNNLPPGGAEIVRAAYADATGQVFLIAILTFVAVWLMPVTQLRTKIEEPEEGREQALV